MNLPIYLKIQSNYSDDNTSKYRWTLTQNILLPSLKAQSSKDYSVILEQSENDPYFSRRCNAFCKVCEDVSVHSDGLEGPRIEVEFGDDDFLRGSFIESLRRIDHRSNCSIEFVNGFIFHHGKLRTWHNKSNVVSVTVLYDPDNPQFEQITVTEPSWIYVRHSQNLNYLPTSQIVGPEIHGLNWTGWNPELVKTYCDIELKTGKASGLKLWHKKRWAVARRNNMKPGTRRR